VKEIIVNRNHIVAPWVMKRAGGTWDASQATMCATLGLLSLERGLIAGVVYEGYNGANIEMHVAATPGANWLNRQFLWAAFHYPFEQLGLKRVTGVVPAANAHALQFDLKLGFSIEATLKDAHPTGDVHILRMMRDECRWLKLFKDRNHELRKEVPAAAA